MHKDWNHYLRADCLNWLLEKNNPSVRFLTLTQLLEKKKTHPEVIQSRNNIMESGVVPKILAKQKKGGYWEEPENFYIRTKYNGTVWQFIILSELGADKQDSRIIDTCEFILDYSQDRQSGGFSYRGTGETGGYHSGVIPCLTGNMTWSLVRFGYLDDPRVKEAIQWIITYLRFDDGIEQELHGWPYDRFEQCWGQHTCFLAVVKSLKSLAEIPSNKRSPAVKDTIEKAAEFILAHHLYKRSHNLSKVAKSKWLKLGFPWMWDTDVLEMLGILLKLGYKDERMQEGMDLVLSKQDESGRWLLEQTYAGRYKVNIEQKNKPSKWITLNALRALKEYNK
ncbi:nitrogen fixation protein NifH [Acidobacteriota bacterium]